MTALIIFTLPFFAIVTLPLTTIFHELGHAIPTLLLTKDKVSVYIGSHGDPNQSHFLKIGRLNFYFKYKFSMWKLGLSVPGSTEISFNRQIIILLMGPLTSLLIGPLILYCAISMDLHGSLKLLGLVWLISSFMDFCYNIIPDDRPIKLYDGRIVYNDGEQLKRLFQLRPFYSQYIHGVKSYNKLEYLIAGEVFHSIISKGIKNEQVYRLAIYSFYQTKNYQQALSIHEKLAHHFELSSNDFLYAGICNSLLGDQEKAVSDYHKSLELNPDNFYTLNNRGYSYILTKKFEKAISDFDNAIKLSPNLSYAYSNRGFAKIKSGNEPEGLVDIRTAIELDATNSYAYLNQGVYHFDKGEYNKALENFEKAYELDHETLSIEQHLLEVREKLNQDT